MDMCNESVIFTFHFSLLPSVSSACEQGDPLPPLGHSVENGRDFFTGIRRYPFLGRFAHVIDTLFSINLILYITINH